MIGRSRVPELPPAPAWSPALAVARGAALFDRNNEHWRKRLAGLPLRVSSLRECPLGRLYGSYQAGCEALGLSRAEAVACGFMWPASRCDDVTLRAEMDAAWAAQVAGGAA